MKWQSKCGCGNAKKITDIQCRVCDDLDLVNQEIQKGFDRMKPEKMPREERDALVGEKFLADVAVVKATGVKSSTAYEVVARAHGFNTYMGMLTARRQERDSKK